jgi:hypothetical protein
MCVQREIADLMSGRKIQILCVQETRWRGNKCKDNGDGCKLVNSGADSRGGMVRVLY